MQNINHDLRKNKTKIEQESWLRQFHRTLDSLGNNLMGMLWMMHLSLAALQETPEIDQAKQNLEAALKAGDRAKDLMRLVLNSLKSKPVSTPIFRPRSGPRIKRCKIYYSSRKNGEYLRQVINSSGIGIVGETDNLKHVTAQGVRGADVVILEYHENNPKLDQWIQESTANPQGPPIYLYFHKFSMVKLWKALHLGVKECLIFPVKEEQLQAAVNRIEDWTRTPTGKGDSGVKRRPHAHTTSA
jgi:PleD family two-component response regulator